MTDKNSNYLTVKGFLAAVLCAACLAAGPARAADQPPNPRDMLEDGVKGIVGAMEMLLMSIPQYEAPEILPNGDILIRRRQPMPKDEPAPPKATPENPPAETRT